MAGELEMDSFEEYKKYLEEGINYLEISKPPRVMSAYNLFYYERQRSGKERNKKYLGNIAEEWRMLPEEKKEYYVQIEEVRKKQYNDLKIDYEILVKKSKSSSAYICYFKEQYPIISKENGDLGYEMITKIIAVNWKRLNQQNKLKYDKLAQCQKEKNNNIQLDKKQLIYHYQENIKKFIKKLGEDKRKAVKRYGKMKNKEYKIYEQNKQKEKQRKKNKQQSNHPTIQAQNLQNSYIKIEEPIKLQKTHQQNNQQMSNTSSQLVKLSQDEQKQLNVEQRVTKNTRQKKRNPISNRTDIKLQQSISDNIKIQQNHISYYNQLNKQQKNKKLQINNKTTKNKCKNVNKNRKKSISNQQISKQPKIQPSTQIKLEKQPPIQQPIQQFLSLIKKQ